MTASTDSLADALVGAGTLLLFVGVVARCVRLEIGAKRT
jgi:hypothetical protein